MRRLTPALPLLSALIIASLLIVMLGENPYTVYQTLVRGSLGTSVKVADTLVVWTSLTIVSAGLLISFRAGQWNIGIEGQIGMGAVFAFAAARLFWESNGFVAITAMLLAGIVGGMFWGVIVALLKIYGNVNEIFGGLALNYVVNGLTIYLIAGPWKQVGSSNVSASETLPQTIWLPTVGTLRVSLVSLTLAVTIAIVVYIALRGTVWGLQLKAVGKNLRSAILLGIPTERVLLSAYIACGACAGLAGALLLAGFRHQLIPSISGGHGFLGILIVLLSAFNGAWLAPIAFFFAAASVGGTSLRISLGLDSSLGGVLIGLIVLSFELLQGIRARFFGERAAA